MLPIYVNNHGAKIIHELIKNISKQLVKCFGDKIIDESFFKINNKEDFPGFLLNACDNLDGYNGIFIIIDNIDDLEETHEFSDWYNAMFETLYFYDELMPIAFSFVGLSSKFEELCGKNPSFSRMFNLIDMDLGWGISNGFIND